MFMMEDGVWDRATFAGYVEGLRRQVRCFPSPRVPFVAERDLLTLLTFFAIWKAGKVACPLSPRLPDLTPYLQQLQAPQFTPTFPSRYHAADDEMVWDMDATATMLFTSGSSGRPKLVAHSFRNHILSARGSLIALNEQSHWALTLPLCHVGGIAIIWRTYLAGATMVLPSLLHKATHISSVPTQLFRWLRNNVAMPELEVMLLGGAPIPEVATPWRVVPSYGMTEMSSQIVTGDVLHPSAEMILNCDGEIWVRGGVLCQGYVQDDLSIQSPVNSLGWFPTRDLGRWHAGKFEVIGRKDHQFICGGENVQPEEIERCIEQLCGQSGAIVVPLYDPEFGARPAVYLAHASELASIQTILSRHLPKWKIPIRAFALPGSDDWKLSRQQLTELANKQVL